MCLLCFTSPTQEKKLLKHPHEQKYTKSKASKRQKIQHFLRQYRYAIKKNDPRNIFTSSTTLLIIFSGIACTYLNTVRRQGAGCRNPIRCVHFGSRALRICMLMPSRPQMRAATVRVKLHLPARDQVGLQAWRDRNRDGRMPSFVALKWNWNRPELNFVIRV